MAESVQICMDCNGFGDLFPDVGAETARHFSPEECSTCDGTGLVARSGPYRLQDGTWSDGVDRCERIDSRPCSSRYEVTTSKNSSHVWHGSDPEVEFDTWAEAIAYADRAARTTKNGDNK